MALRAENSGHTVSHSVLTAEGLPQAVQTGWTCHTQIIKKKRSLDKEWHKSRQVCGYSLGFYTKQLSSLSSSTATTDANKASVSLEHLLGGLQTRHKTSSGAHFSEKLYPYYMKRQFHTLLHLTCLLYPMTKTIYWPVFFFNKHTTLNIFIRFP